MTPYCLPSSFSCSINSSSSSDSHKNSRRSLSLFLYRDFSPALFNSAPILPSGSSMSNQLTPQLSSDSSPGQASSLGLRPGHDPMLTSPPSSSVAKGLEDGKDGYELRGSFYFCLLLYLLFFFSVMFYLCLFSPNLISRC